MVFLQIIHEIRWDGMWSRTSVESKTQLLIQPLHSRRAQDYNGANQSEGSSIVTMRSDSPLSTWSASRSLVAKGRGSSHNVRAPGCGSWPWHITTSRCTDERLLRQQMHIKSKNSSLERKPYLWCNLQFLFETRSTFLGTVWNGHVAKSLELLGREACESV